MKAILYDNGVEVKRAEYPREDMALVYNLQVGLEWKLIEQLNVPVYDSLTHRIQYRETATDLPHPDYPHLKKVVIDYEVIALTQLEIDKILADALDLEDEVNEQQAEQDGLALIRRCRKRLRRRVADSRLTANRSNTLRRWFSQLFFHLRNGDWDLANEDILSASFPTSNNNDINREIDWLKARINEYLNTVV